MAFVYLLLLFVAVSQANNWDTYPQVPKTASINGFADPIYGDLPKCARKCVEFSTGNTPCPYWDTGCLCVMPQWSGAVAQCIAEKCQDKDVVSATSLAYELCSSVGANVWLMPASITAALTSAAGKDNVAAPTPTETAWNTLLDEEDQSAALSSNPQAKSTKSSSAHKTSKDVKSTKSTDESTAESTNAKYTAKSTSSDSGGSSDSSSEGMGVTLTAGFFTVIVGTFFSLLM